MVLVLQLTTCQYYYEFTAVKYEDDMTVKKRLKYQEGILINISQKLLRKYCFIAYHKEKKIKI